MELLPHLDQGNTIKKIFPYFFQLLLYSYLLPDAHEGGPLGLP